MKVFFDDATTLTGARTIPRAMMLVYGTRTDVELEAVTAQDNLPIDLESLGCKEWILEIKPAFGTDEKPLLTSSMNDTALSGNKFSFSLGLFSMSLYTYLSGRSKSPAILSMSGYRKLNDPASKLAAFQFMITVQGRSNINVDTCSTSSLEALGEALSYEIEARKAGDNDLQNQIDLLVITGGQVTVNGIAAVDGDITLNLENLADVSSAQATLLKSIQVNQTVPSIQGIRLATEEQIKQTYTIDRETIVLSSLTTTDTTWPTAGEFYAYRNDGTVVVRVNRAGAAAATVARTFLEAWLITSSGKEYIMPDITQATQGEGNAVDTTFLVLTLEFGSGFSFTGISLEIGMLSPVVATA